MRRVISILLLLGVLGAAVLFWLTMPSPLTAASIPDHKADLKNGELMFYAGGCASCHAAPASNKCDDPKAKDKLRLEGGRCFLTPFGSFSAPNISPDKETGIGGWSTIDFINAMVKGISPDGRHYYPAFPYTSYQRMRLEDLIDLKAYLDTLPAVRAPSKPHDLALPFKFRGGLGLWKMLYLDGKTFEPDPTKSDEINRGAYLVEGPGHCAACHSPRDVFGGFKPGLAYSGGPSPEGKGRIPNITPDKTGIGSWSKKDIAYALESGFTPSFDTFGGSMVAVQENMAKLPASDREAIAAYLKTLPPVSTPKKK